MRRYVEANVVSVNGGEPMAILDGLIVDDALEEIEVAGDLHDLMGVRPVPLRFGRGLPAGVAKGLVVKVVEFSDGPRSTIRLTS